MVNHSNVMCSDLLNFRLVVLSFNPIILNVTNVMIVRGMMHGSNMVKPCKTKNGYYPGVSEKYGSRLSVVTHNNNNILRLKNATFV